MPACEKIEQHLAYNSCKKKIFLFVLCMLISEICFFLLIFFVILLYRSWSLNESGCLLRRLEGKRVRVEHITSESNELGYAYLCLRSSKLHQTPPPPGDELDTKDSGMRFTTHNMLQHCVYRWGLFYSSIILKFSEIMKFEQIVIWHLTIMSFNYYAQHVEPVCSLDNV